jgi:hypothetical protein
MFRYHLACLRSGGPEGDPGKEAFAVSRGCGAGLAHCLWAGKAGGVQRCTLHLCLPGWVYGPVKP